MQEQKVTLMSFSPSEVIDKLYTACRTCYAAGTPQELYSQCKDKTSEQKWKLIKHVLDSGHHSVLEHATFTFLISGVSRALSHQLVRHRIGVSYSQQSQRYCTFKTGFEYVTPPLVTKNEEVLKKYDNLMSTLNETYQEFVALGLPAEDARMILPNACCTNLTCTMNIRELIHFCNERMCTCAQWEIRKMARGMANAVTLYLPELKEYLGPKCQTLGYCNENADRSCGLRPPKENIMRP